MTIAKMKSHLDELSKKHPLGDNAPLMFTVRRRGSDELDYDCTVFSRIHIAKNPCGEDLAYVDLEIDG